MKGSIFRTFFTLLLMFALFLSFVNAQKNKTNVSKSASTNKPAITTKPLIDNKLTRNLQSPTSSISANEQAILEEINAIRNDPQKYIAYLQAYRKLFKGNIVYIPGETGIETNEGTDAVDESIEFLKTAAKLSPYTLSKGLSQSANLQLKDLIEDSSIFHKGKNGSTLSQRLAKFGNVGDIFAENISFHAKTPREIVLTMLIDDGIKSRSHRKNIFSSKFKEIGLGFGNGKNGEVLCVAVFADSFRER